MTITDVFRDGFHRVKSAPAILIGMFLITLLLALPLGLVLRDMLRSHLGDSVAAETVASGVNFDWWQEFAAQATGVGTTFSPTIIGFAAVLDNLGALLDNQPRATVLVGAATAYLVVWAFFVGGIVDRYARNRPTRAAGFFAASGIYFFRFIRLAIIAWMAYGLVFGLLHGWLFDGLYAWLIRDMTAERGAFVLRLILYLAFGAALLFCNVVLDYAKIRAVVEDRRSMIGATVAGFRFVVRRPKPVFSLYLLNGSVFLFVLLVYAVLAPGAGGTGASMWFGFLIGQAYVFARLSTKLLFLATQTAFFQAELAHAGYTAAPPRVEPESPAAEAIGRTPAAGGPQPA